MKNLLAVAIWGLAVVLPSVPVEAASCDRLPTLRLTNTVIALAQDVGPGVFVPPGTKPGEIVPPVYASLPAFCRVIGVIRPSGDSNIKFEVWLPISGWNGKYLGVGNGGVGGFIAYTTLVPSSNAPGLAQAIQSGFAASSTDTGHEGAPDDASFARGNPEKRIDNYYRAIHETALAAKAVIRAFYGTAARYAYFSGCSDGGRQGLIEVQRYPADYDGVLVCAHGGSSTELAVIWTWVARAFAEESERDLLERKLPLVQAAVLASCDGVDGLRDGVIGDPYGCQFDPSTLQCRTPSSDSCLTPSQVAAFEKFYRGPTTSSGEVIAPGFPPGAETDPSGSILCKTCVASAGRRAATLFEGLLEGRFHVQTFNFDRDVRMLADTEVGKLRNATESDLTSFARRGGKLILVHGWSDGTAPALTAVNYYNRVVSTMGSSAADGFLRLYLAPGMQHGGGGPGPNTFHQAAMTALERWVEAGTAPDAIVATKYNINGSPDSGVARTRPLCPYPKVAEYSGSGSIDEAANFSCRMQ